MGWLRSFSGGTLVTCGLRNAGAPSHDSGEDLGMHGRIGNTPAENVSVNNYWNNDEYLIEISGKLREANLFGENLMLSRIIKTGSDKNEIQIFDTISNENFRTEPLMLLYHLNWGFPLFDENAELIIDSESTVVRGEDQSKLSNWNAFSKPIYDFTEIVYFHQVRADKNNRCAYQLHNQQLGIGVRVSWNKDVLPYLIEWKMTGEGDYVLGLEPANCLAGGRAKEREEGRLVNIASFEQKMVDMRIEVYDL
jgi:hypothetical protein